jgi:hypothetical protein
MTSNGSICAKVCAGNPACSTRRAKLGEGPAFDAAALAPRQRPDQRDVLRAGADERLAHGEMSPDSPLPVGCSVGRAVGAEPASLAQGAGVPLVGLDPAVAGGVHGREVRVGYYHLVPERFEVTSAPLALGRCLDEDARRRSTREQLVEALPLGLDAALDEFAVFGQDADLAGGLVQVDADEIHGWS